MSKLAHMRIAYVTPTWEGSPSEISVQVPPDITKTKDVRVFVHEAVSSIFPQSAQVDRPLRNLVLVGS